MYLIGRACALSWAVAVVPLSVLLLWVCATSQGAVFALAAIALGLAPLLWSWQKRWSRRVAVMGLSLWLGMTCWLAWQRPDGHGRVGGRVSNCYVGGGWNYQRLALGALLPEVDQFLLGFKVMAAVDPLLTTQQVRELARLTRTIYAELEANRDFHALGSAMPEAYRELRGQRSDHGHYFLYVPPRLDPAKPAGAMVFLHGSGGNFKAYTWLLSQVADELGMVLIAPSYGMGDWDAPRAPGAVIAALDDAALNVRLDLGDIHLMGLSNGGLGVTRTAASDHGSRFRTMVLLSAVCDLRALDSPGFAASWQGKPALLVTGEDDDRVPLPFVRQCADTLENAGLRVDLIPFPGANHFLFFSHRDQVLKTVSAWLAGHRFD